MLDSDRAGLRARLTPTGEDIHVAYQALKEEIQSSLGSGPNPRGKTILRSVTDLFVNRADDYSDEQVEVFDDVMHCLLDYTEHDARVELSDAACDGHTRARQSCADVAKGQGPSRVHTHTAAIVCHGRRPRTEFVKQGNPDRAMMIAKRPFINKW